MTTCLAFAMPGALEMCIIGIVAVLLFGGRLPTLARSFGQSIWEFKKGLAMAEVGVDDIKREAIDIKKELEKEIKT